MSMVSFLIRTTVIATSVAEEGLDFPVGGFTSVLTSIADILTARNVI